MLPQRILYLSAHHMAAYRWQSGTLLGEGTFTASESGLQHFREYLTHNARSVFTLLANVAEEGFHIESIPFLRGSDRTTVIQRKLAQTFFNTPLTASLSQKKEKNRRKDERLLLAALTNPVFFQPWLDAIRDTDVAFSGLFSLPLVLASFLKKLRLPDEPCLLLSVQDQSIRQSYFEKGQLHFSRVTPLQHSSIGSIAQALSSESLKLQQYLASQRLLGRNQTITAHVLAHASARNVIETSCLDTPTLRFNILDISECAGRIGLKSLPADSHSELLFLHMLAIAPPSAQFAEDSLRHTYQIGQFGTVLRGIGLVTMIACLLLSGKQLVDAYQLRGETAQFQAEAAGSRQRYADVVKTFPNVSVDNETLRSVIGRYLAHEQQSISPTPFYIWLSRILLDHPSIELASLEWLIGGAELRAGAGAKAEDGIRPVSDDSESLVVRGVLQAPPGTDTRQLLQSFNRFVEQLKADDRQRVDILQPPLNIESGKALRSSDTTSENGASRAFSLKVSRKIGS